MRGLSAIKCAILAFAVTLAVYWPAVRYEMVDFDDTCYVRENVHMREGLTRDNLRWALTSCGYAYNWHPLAWASLMGDVSAVRALRGGAPIDDAEWMRYDGRLAHVMHFHNILLHAANAALLLILMSALSRGRTPWPWMLALTLLWSLHPLRTEVVCWVAERKELLSVMFMLLTMLAYARGGVVFSFFAFTLALLAKPVAVTLPAVLFAWDWVIAGRKFRTSLIRSVPFVLLSAGACWLTMAAQTVTRSVGREQTAILKVSAVFNAPIVYLRQTVWPFGLSIFYPASERLDPVLFPLGVLLVAGVVLTGVLWLRRRSAGLGIAVFAVAWVYVGLLPMIGIVKVGDQEHSDRYTYWIACGGAVVLSMALGHFLPRLRSLAARELKIGWQETVRRATYVLFALVVVAAWAARVRMSCWQGTVTLFRDVVRKSWQPEYAEVLAIRLSERGAGGRAEGEAWLRQCAVNFPSADANIRLAKWLLGKPEDRTVSEFATPYAEPEMLMREVLEHEPGNGEAKELLKKIREKRKGAK